MVRAVAFCGPQEKTLQATRHGRRWWKRLPAKAALRSKAMKELDVPKTWWGKLIWCGSAIAIAMVICWNVIG